MRLWADNKSGLMPREQPRASHEHSMLPGSVCSQTASSGMESDVGLFRGLLEGGAEHGLSRTPVRSSQSAMRQCTRP